MDVKRIWSIARKTALGAACAACGLSASGCHLDMWNTGRVKPYEESQFFDDGQSSRTLVAGTVPYQSRQADTHYYSGKTATGEFAKGLPEEFEINREFLERGRLQYEVYCYPCHGMTGNGDGLITKRGFPAPPSYHIDRLRTAPLGYIYDTITNGFGRMYSYASRVKPEDRWAIAAYIRTLQLSQGATPDILPAEVVEQAKNPPAEEPEGQDEENNEH